MKGSGVGFRLLAATVVIVAAGCVTAWLVATTVGPAVFHRHMIASRAADEPVLYHAEQAFRDASTLALSMALLAALIASVLVSMFLTRRLTRPVAAATTAAGAVTAGDYSARMPRGEMGREFDELAEAFNTMATELGEVEATRTELLGNLAHEMRTPLATLDGYLEAILDGVRGADEETLAMLRGQVSRLTRLSEDVAMATTAEEGRLSMRRVRVSAADLLASAHAEAKGRFQDRDATLTMNVSPPAATTVVNVDPDRLAQVLTNLLDNALRHTTPGGRVELTADRDDGQLLLRVADNGDGIAAEHLPHVFDRFYRADTARDRAHGGSGLGLAIVRAITRAHGGTVAASSPGPGKGATVTVRLPAT